MRNLLVSLFIVLAGGLAVFPSPGLAQETRTALPGEAPPRANVSDLAWLVGHWSGTGIGGNPAFETYSPATADTIVSHFVQMDDRRRVQFSELVYISQQGGSLVMRLKHFNGDLTGWEQKDEMESFPLVAIADGAAYFDGLTLRRDGPDGLVSAVRIKGKDGTESELVFRYKRVELTVP